MKTILSIVIGAFIFYVSYHGSIGVLYDVISLAFPNKEGQAIFVQSTSFDDIAAFSSFLLPAIITSIFLGLFHKTKPVYFGVALCGAFSVLLWGTLAYFFGFSSSLRVSDLLAPLSVLPVSWFILSLVQRHA